MSKVFALSFRSDRLSNGVLATLIRIAKNVSQAADSWPACIRVKSSQRSTWVCPGAMKTIDFMSQPVDLVWNKGIAASCDRRIPDEFPDGQRYSTIHTLAGALWSRKLPDNLISDPARFRDIRDGELVWVRLSWLRSFIKQVLPLVRARFVLVTGDSDSSVPSELASEARAILDSANVLHWYTQNYDGLSGQDRVSPLPIGIDFHMLSEGPYWGEGVTCPARQEQTLISVGDTLPPLENRIPKVYVDFAWQRGFGLRHYRRFHPLPGTEFRENRRRIVKKLGKNQLIFPQTTFRPRTELWRARGEYAFVLSPHGMGLDCHRTWEALALGHIVLVPSSALDPLYAGLPVAILKSWGDITPENLRKWLLHYRENKRVHEKLKTSFWIEKMRATAERRAALATG